MAATDKKTTTQILNRIKSWVLLRIADITELIPSAASALNQLADKAFVNSSIATATATFRGTYNLVSDLSLTTSATQQQIAAALATKMSALSITPDNNDYCFVQIPTADATPTQIARIDKYKFNGTAWSYEYSLNNSGFTSAQWAAINSGATLELIGKLSALPTNAELTNLLNAKANKSEMSFTDGTGSNADKTTIQLKTGTSKQVLISHIPQDNAPTENSNNNVKSGGVHTALVNTVAGSGVFDLSVHNAVNGVPATYANLSAAITALNALPLAYKKGGMSFKFVRSSDNKYVQYRLMSSTFNTTAANWQGEALSITKNGKNLTTEEAVYNETYPLEKQIDYVRTKTYSVTENVDITTTNNPLIMDIPANTKFSIEIRTENQIYKDGALYLYNSNTNAWVSIPSLYFIEYPLEIEKNYPISAIAFKAKFAYTGDIIIEGRIIKSILNSVTNQEKYTQDYLSFKSDVLEPGQGLFRTFPNKFTLKAGTYTMKAVASSAISGRTWIRLMHDNTIIIDIQIPANTTEKSGKFTLQVDTECQYTVFTDTARSINVEIISSKYLPKRVSKLEEDVSSINTELPQEIDRIEGISESSIKEAYILSDNVKSKNILDLSAYKWTNGLLDKNGTVYTENSYLYCDLIPVTPGVSLFFHYCTYIAAYDADKLIQEDKGVNNTETRYTFVVPEGIYYLRTSVLATRLIRNDGAVAELAYVMEDEDSNTYVPYQNSIRHKNVHKHLKLHDALYAWMNGEKFPVAFLGDSTTDGVGTTGYSAANNSHESADNAAGGEGYADWQHPYAYPYILEQLLRKELNNNVLRIYNAGWGGWSMRNSLDISNYAKIFGHAYADVKMVGIVMGLNDRTFVSTPLEYYTTFKQQLIQASDLLIKMGITPFMVSYNAMTQAGNDGNGTYSSINQNYVQQLANIAKKEVAEIFGLEYVDMNEFGSLVLRCSNYPMIGSGSSIGVTEHLHFKDLGHKLEAGFLFTKFIPWILKTESADKLYVGLSNLNFKCDIIMQSYTQTQDGFKVEINKTKGDNTDVCIYDAYVFNNSVNGPYSVKYQTPVASGYIVIDGDTANPIAINATEINLGTWDIGLHHVQVYTGESTTVAFKGFLLEQQN